MPFEGGEATAECFGPCAGRTPCRPAYARRSCLQRRCERRRLRVTSFASERSCRRRRRTPVAAQSRIETLARFALCFGIRYKGRAQQSRRHRPVAATQRESNRIKSDLDHGLRRERRAAREVEHALAGRAGQFEFRLQPGCQRALERSTLPVEV